LAKKRALKEYDVICDQIKSLEVELAEVEKYRLLLSQFQEDQVNLSLDKAKIKKEGLDYLKEIKPQLENVEETFRTLVKKFYENKGGSLEIKETVDAKYLFDIEPHIPKDGSQGVSEVKIFCYDILLYLLNKDLLGFIAHDGCIFSEMDPRQKSKIFKVALEKINENNLQYFVNIGENSLNEVLDEHNEIGILDEQEKEIIRNAQILKLYDKDPQTWLFGEEFK
jgi:uncharacterized protein YydD (DUF2326 family)